MIHAADLSAKIRYFYGTLLLAFLSVFDAQVASLFVSQIQSELSASLKEASNIVNFYLIAELCVMPLFGLLIRSLGQGRVLFYSSVVFILGSILCGIAPDIYSMLVFRVLQGGAGGVLMLFPYYYASNELPENVRPHAFNTYLLVSAMGPLLAPIIGGLLVESVSWRALFLVNLPLCMIVLSYIKPWNIVLIAEGGPIARHKIFAAFVLMAVLILTETTLSKGSELGWFNAEEFSSRLLVVLFLMIGFLAIEIHFKDPLLNYRIFENAQFAMSCLVNVVAGMCVFGYMFLLPFFLFHQHGFSPTEIGVFFIYLAVPQILFITTLKYLHAKWYCFEMVALGLFLYSLAFLLLSDYIDDLSYPYFNISQLLRSFAMPLIFSPLSVLAFALLKKEQSSDAAIWFNVSRTFGGVVGVAVITAIFQNNLNGALLGLNLTGYYNRGLDEISFSLDNLEDLVKISTLTTMPTDMYINLNDYNINEHAAQKVAFFNLFNSMVVFVGTFGLVLGMLSIFFRFRRLKGGD